MEVIPTHADVAPRELLRIAADPDWHAGSAEPWVRDTLAALVHANATRVAVEIGCFEGYTSRALARTLAALPWDTTLLLCELDPERAAKTRTSVDADGLRQHVHVIVADSLQWIPTLAAESVDFVWLDGCHEKPHVLDELRYLLPKMAPGGIIAGHDVYGVCELKDIFAIVAHWCDWPSMSLDLPRLGPAGGIGLLQRPR